MGKRKLAAVIASGLLGSALLVPAPSAGAGAAVTNDAGQGTRIPDSAALSTPILAQGRLTAADGRPATGTVRLHVWPRWNPGEAGSVALPLVAWTTARPDGSFILRETIGLVALAGPPDQSRNLLLLAEAGGRRYETNFARRPAAPAWLTGMDSPAAPVDIRIDPTEAVGRSLPGATPTGMCHRRKLEEYPNRLTIVGEINSASFVQKASFTYEEREDSFVSVAVGGGVGTWRASGEYHLDKATGVKAVFNISDSGNYKVLSPFTYVRYDVLCGGGDGTSHEEIRAELWEGGGRLDAQNRPGCAGSKWAREWPADSELERNSFTAYTWGGAASAGPASFTAHSGFSRYLVNKWAFDKSAPSHVVCGDNNYVTKSARVFLGAERPESIDDCRRHNRC